LVAGAACDSSMLSRSAMSVSCLMLLGIVRRALERLGARTSAKCGGDISATGATMRKVGTRRRVGFETRLSRVCFGCTSSAGRAAATLHEKCESSTNENGSEAGRSMLRSWSSATLLNGRGFTR
jgi:hypothetical protein